MGLVVGFEPYVVRVKGGCPSPLDDTSIETSSMAQDLRILTSSELKLLWAMDQEIHLPKEFPPKA